MARSTVAGVPGDSADTAIRAEPQSFTLAGATTIVATLAAMRKLGGARTPILPADPRWTRAVPVTDSPV